MSVRVQSLGLGVCRKGSDVSKGSESRTGCVQERQQCQLGLRVWVCAGQVAMPIRAQGLGLGVSRKGSHFS